MYPVPSLPHLLALGRIGFYVFCFTAERRLEERVGIPGRPAIYRMMKEIERGGVQDKTDPASSPKHNNFKFNIRLILRIFLFKSIRYFQYRIFRQNGIDFLGVHQEEYDPDKKERDLIASKELLDRVFHGGADHLCKADVSQSHKFD